MNFQQKWNNVVSAKNSILCAGLDPAEYGQRPTNTISEGVNKLQWCLSFIEQISPYAAAVKINRNYIKDFSRNETGLLCDKIHDLGMLAIDDIKLADIGCTNEASFYHTAMEGFDAITYAPFPGNIGEAVKQAHQHELGIIVLTILSNPEYKDIKTAKINNTPLFQYIAEQVAEHRADAVVIGAPNLNNHITLSEITTVANIIPNDTLVLVPGIGTQGGELSALGPIFGNRIIANVGRTIMYAKNPCDTASSYKQMLNQVNQSGIDPLDSTG